MSGKHQIIPVLENTKTVSCKLTVFVYSFYHGITKVPGWLRNSSARYSSTFIPFAQLLSIGISPDSRKRYRYLFSFFAYCTANTASTRPFARSKPATSTDRIGHAHGALYHCCFQTPRRNFSTVIAACRRKPVGKSGGGCRLPVRKK